MTDRLNDIAATAQDEATRHARTCGTWRLVEIVQGLTDIYPTAQQGTPEHLADYVGQLNGYYGAMLQRGMFGSVLMPRDLVERLLDQSAAMAMRRYERGL